MELNPAFDVDGRTARIGALLALTFIAGHAERA
jgi:arginase family enzyme